MTTALIRRLEQHHTPYALLVQAVDEPLRLHELGLNTVVGDLDDPEACRRVGVGRAIARAFTARQVDYRIVELLAERVSDEAKRVVGNAADLEVLKQAGIDETPTVLITPQDDDLNVYLTVHCRRLRPDIQIISRATLERNVPTLHRGGADIVMSYAEMGASMIMNWLRPGRILTVAEGLDRFRVHVPPALAGKTIAESEIRIRSGCTVVGISTAQGMEVVPGPGAQLPSEADVMLIGTADAEERFLQRWGDRERPGAG